MKVKKRIVLFIMLFCGIMMIPLSIGGCDKKAERPKYEIKLFDDDWNEVTMMERKGDYLIDYDVKYDGTVKGLNAICYMDGEEIYRYAYKDGFIQGNMVAVWSQFNGVGGWGITEFPSKYGRYRFTYTFDRGLGTGKYYKTKKGKIVSTDLPLTMYHVSMYIYTSYR